MKVKTLLVSSLSIIAFNLPLTALADLTIVNHTKKDSTSIINAGLCSSTLGEGGISRAGKPPLVVPDSLIKLACAGNLSNCVADVYMTSNCTGQKVGTVVFDIKTGTKSVTLNPSSSYKITSALHSFTFTLDGGPTAI